MVRVYLGIYAVFPRTVTVDAISRPPRFCTFSETSEIVGGGVGKFLLAENVGGFCLALSHPKMWTNGLYSI